MLDRTLTFGRYRLEPRGGLMSGDRDVRLTPKALALLSFMAERPGEVITKEELFGAVWPEVNVGDAALVTCIQELRRALGDDARRPRYIETLHRRGYRFVGKMTTRLPAAIGGKAHALPLPDRPSIAVLPFANMSDDPDQAYFADGISEDLITGLSRIHWLFVIARNSTFVYKNRAVDVKQVSRELGVRYVLEGSVRRAGKRIRISAQLIDATTGGHHWAERYDRELGDIFAVQDEITNSVAAAIEPRLLAAEGVRALARSPDDLGAWELVARAQTQFWRMTRPRTTRRPSARSSGLSRPIRIMRRRAACWGFVWCSRRIWGGSSATRDCSQAANTRFGRSRSMIEIPGDTSRSATGP